jgi:hypothetical protein
VSKKEYASKDRLRKIERINETGNRKTIDTLLVACAAVLNQVYSLDIEDAPAGTYDALFDAYERVMRQVCILSGFPEEIHDEVIWMSHQEPNEDPFKFLYHVVGQVDKRW